MVEQVIPDAGKLVELAKIQPGAWAVFRNNGYGGYYSHQAAIVERVTAKTVYAKAHYRQQHAIGDVLPVESESAAHAAIARLDSLRAESIRRERAAREAYRAGLGKLYLKFGAQPSSDTAKSEGEV